MVTVGIASVPERENCLRQTIESIYKQVDMVFIGLNNYEQTPLWFNQYDNLQYRFFDNSQGDAVKLYLADSVSGYYLTLDDDISVYDIKYVDKMIEGANKYGLVSYHGKVYTSPVTSYKKIEKNLRCLDEVKEDTPVNLIGSGCCCFKTDRLRINIDQFTIPNMADVWLSKVATEQGVPMVVLAHAKGDIKYLYPQGSTIWRDTVDYSRHVEIMNKFIK